MVDPSLYVINLPGAPQGFIRSARNVRKVLGFYVDEGRLVSV